MKTQYRTRVAVILVLLAVWPAALALSQTTVMVAPASASITPQAFYAVDVVVNNVQHLHAAHTVIGFDATILRVDSLKQGPFMGGSSLFYYSPDPVTPGTSSVTIDQALLGSSGVDGSGTLVTLYFTSLKVGFSVLTLQSVTLRDTMNMAIGSTNMGGTVTVEPLRLSPRVFLQGCYVPATTSMRNSLKTGGILSSKFSSVTIPAFAVDSVNVEIRNSSQAGTSTIRRFMPAWLLTDGTMRVFADTTKSGVAFDAPAGAYYVVIRHRNHLAIMSKTAVVLTAALTPYDFTTGQDKAWGTNPLVVFSGGVYGMYAGNSDGSAIITVADYNPVGSQMFQSGYRAGDHDLSGIINVADYNSVGANMFKTSQVP